MNIYSHRQPELIQPLLDAFTKQTGIPVNIAFVDKGMVEKLKAEGVEYIEVDTKPFYDATAPVREKYGAQFAELIQRIEAVQ